mmetsp:Transcript_43873/g.99167  ORF Transcript_43873/g.99167 Transcript_43873/m.99167 type:complete len:243 (-) Transcript_43873:62-790(-)|eukprot:CAMPEP_0172628416 /NCGR_PEP_ID=MMETSP1068-20121228/161703_1 /TAXON_ID=35684 /ORGANISM="Pseudopedinella elastica, Strain CCMP716" /LENGTH=242 /DNA_ID=CAMNT_0013438621 /DNA_START=101 /DNA_END=829 /DNA_ORIENTATION=+
MIGHFAVIFISLFVSAGSFPVSFNSFAFNRAFGVCIKPKIFYAEKGKRFTLRNVPGEGDCVFLAAALATSASMGMGGNAPLLRAVADETRDVVAQVLSSQGNLYIADKRIVRAPDLLKSAAKQEGLTPEEYISRLRTKGKDGGLYGGGPELTVLSNVLRRPISIYHLDEEGDDPTDTCRVKEVALFGNGIFEDPCLNMPDSAVLSGIQPGAFSWHIHILITDVNMELSEKHALVLLPDICDP